MRRSEHAAGKRDTSPTLTRRNRTVIAYTTTISGIAVSELLNRLFGLAKPDATEAVLKFEMRKLSHNDRKARDGCWCAGDDIQHRQPLLGMNWPSTKRVL